MEQLFKFATRTRGLPILARYALTTALVMLGAVLQAWLFGDGAILPFLLFFPAIVFAGVVFDRGTGVYATLLSALIIIVYFIPPRWSLNIADPIHASGILIFIATGLFIAFLLESMHVTMEALVRAHAEAVTMHAEIAEVADAKGTLLSEAVHRARNDLQRLLSTIRLQVASLPADHPAQAPLETVAERVAALAQINLHLDHSRDDGLAVVDARSFLGSLLEDICDSVIGLRPITLDVDVAPGTLTMKQAVPLAILVNELISNALKYAFPDNEDGRIRVALERDGDYCIITVEDDGIGMKIGEPPKGTGLGMQLVRALAAQLGGSVQFASARAGGNRPGTRFTVRIPVAGQKRVS